MSSDVERAEWEGRAVAEWRVAWSVPVLRVFRRIGSTNDLAAEMAADGAPEGTVVLADEQTGGRGRRGRTWSAPPGSSLSLSMVLRPPGPDATRLLTLRLGLAAARALDAVGVDVTLKWPNDLALGDRKVAGILCESSIAENRVTHVVAGIGVNLRQRDDAWPADLAGRATSLAAATGRAVNAPGVAGAIVAEWLGVARSPRATLSPAERSEFRQRDALRGLSITVDGQAAGTAVGITHTGALRIRHDDRIREVIAGTVRTTHTPDAGGRT